MLVSGIAVSFGFLASLATMTALAIAYPFVYPLTKIAITWKIVSNACASSCLKEHYFGLTGKNDRKSRILNFLAIVCQICRFHSDRHGSKGNVKAFPHGDNNKEFPVSAVSGEGGDDEDYLQEDMLHNKWRFEGSSGGLMADVLYGHPVISSNTTNYKNFVKEKYRPPSGDITDSSEEQDGDDVDASFLFKKNNKHPSKSMAIPTRSEVVLHAQTPNEQGDSPSSSLCRVGEPVAISTSTDSSRDSSLRITASPSSLASFSSTEVFYDEKGTPCDELSFSDEFFVSHETDATSDVVLTEMETNISVRTLDHLSEISPLQVANTPPKVQSVRTIHFCFEKNMFCCWLVFCHFEF